MSATLRSTAAPKRRHRALGPTLLIIVAVIAVFVLVSYIYTDWLWYRSLGMTEVFKVRWLTSLLLFGVVGLLMGLSVAASMWAAWRLRPSLPHHHPGALSRSLGVFGSRTTLVVTLISVLVGLLAGASSLSHVDEWLAFRNASKFGITDPYFGLDVSFFTFALPFWRYVAGVAMAVAIVSALMAAGVHLVTGAVRSNPLRVKATVDNRGIQVPKFEFSNPFGPSAQSHLSVMLGIILLVYGVKEILDRYVYAISDNDTLFIGIGYTDAHSRMTAKLIMAIISIICAIVFFATARLRRWRVPVVALVLTLACSIIIQGIYPAVVQRFDVAPNEPVREQPYIQNQIAATRHAYGVDQVEIQDYSAKTDVSAGQLKADAEALPGIRLIDPAIIAPTFEQLQQVRGYYSFPPVLDVDRYTIDGKATDAVVAAREVNVDGLPSGNRTWNNVHTVYTHGVGMVAAHGNQREASGEPVWMEGDIPPNGVLNETEPRVYYGESETQYVVVGAPEGTAPVELDTPGGGQGGNETKSTYTGKGGVPVGNPLVRAMYAVRFADINLLLSGRMNSASKLAYNRTPKQVMAQVAPWLKMDADPYPAVVDGRLVWIIDGYTTSDSYPNSQRVTLANAISDSASGWRGIGSDPTTVNYMRNSVKAYLDAFDGSVHLYDFDPADPVLQTWMKAYPGVVEPASNISASLKSHMRYPQDLFKVQRQILSRYHMTDSDSWYQQADLWTIPQDPRSKSNQLEPPYYLSIRWPGDTSPVFSQTASFIPNNRENLGAFMSVVADATSPLYGQLRVLKLSDSAQVPGPNQTYNAIVSDAGVAAKLLPFGVQGGSGSAVALYGNLLTLPLGGGLIYIEPIYTQRKDTASGSTASGSYPVLRFVVVRFGSHIGIGDTLQQALDSVFGGDAGASTGENTTPTANKPGQTPGASTPSSAPSSSAPSGASPTQGNTASATAEAALGAAQQYFSAADTALRAGDLAGYQSNIAQAKAKVAEAAKALGG